MPGRAAQIEEDILLELSKARFPVTLQDVMRSLGFDMKDAKPYNAMKRLVAQGLVERRGSSPPYRFTLITGSTAPPAAGPSLEAVVPSAAAEPEPTEAEVTEADVERPTDKMTQVTGDEVLTALRTRLEGAVAKAASDEEAVSAAQQEAITELIHDHGPQLGAQIVDALGLQKEQAVTALRTMIKAGVLQRSGGSGAPFELVQRGVMDLLKGGEVMAVCTACGEIARSDAATPATVRSIFAHDSSHDVRVRAGSGTTYSRKQLERIDAEQKAVKPTPAPAAPAADEVVTFRLPDGRDYSPRAVQGTNTPDVDMLRICRDNNAPVCLYGPPGTGKTAVVGAAFEDALTINGDGDTAVADFVGTWTMSGDPGQPYVWGDGPLTTAMKEGRPLFIDDFTLISGKVLSVLYPVMDGRGRIFVKEHLIKQDDGSYRPEVVEARKGFWVVGGHNPGVHGAVLSPALASRFSLHIEVPSDYELAERMGISRKAVKTARNLAVAAEAGRVGWWPQLRELMAFDKIANLLGEDAAIANLAGICPEEDRTEVMTELKNCFGREVALLKLGSQIGS